MKNWNDTITNGDTVYILEDISMRGTNGERIASVEKLKRQKVLIKGNHDKVSNFRYKLVFSWNGMNRGIVLLYEHVHEVAEDTYFQKCIDDMQNECRHAIGQTVKAYNVGCMKSAIDYRPRTLEEIIDRNKEMKMVT